MTTRRPPASFGPPEIHNRMKPRSARCLHTDGLATPTTQLTLDYRQRRARLKELSLEESLEGCESLRSPGVLLMSSKTGHLASSLQEDLSVSTPYLPDRRVRF